MLSFYGQYCYVLKSRALKFHIQMYIVYLWTLNMFDWSCEVYVKFINLSYFFKSTNPWLVCPLSSNHYNVMYRFTVRFDYDLGDGIVETPFMINPRFDQKAIVRNCKLGGVWGQDETFGGLGPLQKGHEFTLTILVHDSHYRVSYWITLILNILLLCSSICSFISNMLVFL